LLEGQRAAMRESTRTQVLCVLLSSFTDAFLRTTISHVAYRISHIAYRARPALTVLQTYLCEAKDLSADKTFVYISAEDIFRPVIPARYITTKREAEKEIARQVGITSFGAAVRGRHLKLRHSRSKPQLAVDGARV